MFSQALQDGDILSIAALGFVNWSAEITAQPANTQSAVFELSGTVSNNQTENVVPFTLFGDDGGDYDGVPLQVGEYTLTVRAHASSGGNGAVLASTTINFAIVADFTDAIIFKDSFGTP